MKKHNDIIGTFDGLQRHFSDNSKTFSINVISEIKRYYVYPTLRQGTFILFLLKPRGPLTFLNEEKCVKKFDSVIFNRSDHTFMKERTNFCCITVAPA